MDTNKSLKPTKTKRTSKFEPGYHAVGDEFFDDPPEKYWARIKVEQNHQHFCTIDVPPQFQCNCNRYRDRKDLPNFGTQVSTRSFPPSAPNDLPTANELNKILVPLAEMRMRIAELQGAGVKKMPLVDFLKVVQSVYRENKE